MLLRPQLLDNSRVTTGEEAAMMKRKAIGGVEAVQEEVVHEEG